MDMPKVLEDLRGQLGNPPVFRPSKDAGENIGQVLVWLDWSSKRHFLDDVEALWKAREAILEASAQKPDEGGAEFTSTVRARAMRRGVPAGSAGSGSGSGIDSSGG